MHELSIAISMIEQIVLESECRGSLEVEVVHLRLGVFSGVDPNALLFSYQLASEGTPLQASRLEIESVPLLVFCPRCAKTQAPPSLYQLCCPDCLAPTPQIVSGREIEIASLEVAA